MGTVGNDDKRIYEGVLQWYCHVERMENDMIAKRVYMDRTRKK